MKSFFKKFQVKFFTIAIMFIAVVFSCTAFAVNKNNLSSTNAYFIEERDGSLGYGISQTAYVTSLVQGMTVTESEYNLMDIYPITPENQTHTNHCWSYTSHKALETALMVQAGEYYNFSDVAVPYLGFYNDELDFEHINVGGNFGMFVDIASKYGLVSEGFFSNEKSLDLTDANYLNYDYILDYTNTEIFDNINPVEFYYDPNYNGLDRVAKQDVIKAFIRNYGGLYAGISAGTIYKDTDWIYTTNQSVEVANKYIVGGNHAVCLVGWNEVGFIALNSWGVNVYEFVIPYSIDRVYSTVAGFEYDSQDAVVDIETTSAEDFEALTRYQGLENVFCVGEDLIEITLAFESNVIFENIKIDAYKGSQDVVDAFVFDYNDATSKVTISLERGVLAFEGGSYSFRIFDGVTFLAQKDILIVSGTEISYFNLYEATAGVPTDIENFMHGYLPSDDSVTYYISNQKDFNLDFYLTEFNKYQPSVNNRLNATVGTPYEIYVNKSTGTETRRQATGLSLGLNISTLQNTSNTYTLTIRNLSLYSGKIIRIPLTVNSNITGITTFRTYYINLIVSTDTEARTTDAYAIEYVMSGGVNSPDNIERIPVYQDEQGEMTEFILKKPTKIGCKFIGWYTDKNFTNEITKISAELDSDMAIYAKWEVDTTEYFEMSAAITGATSYDGDHKAPNHTYVYGDKVEFKIDYVPQAILNGYNYTVNYKFFVNDVEYDSALIDKTTKVANVVFGKTKFENAGYYRVRVLVTVVISHATAVAQEQEIVFAISQKEVNFNFSGLEYTYDKLQHMPTVECLGVYTEDKPSFSYVFEKDGQTAVLYAINAGEYNYKVRSISDPNNNYVLAGVAQCNMIINKKSVAIEWDNLTVKYDGLLHAPTYTLQGLEVGDIAEINLSNIFMRDAGEYNLKINTASLSNVNYKLTEESSVKFKILPAEITIRFENREDRASTAPAYRKTISYVIEGNLYDSEDALGLVITCDALNASKAGVYKITATHTNSNYHLTVFEGEYKLLSFYTIKYTLPDGTYYIEEVTDGKPQGVPKSVYNPGIFKKLVYSQKLESNGEDLSVKVEVKDYTFYVVIGAVVVVMIMAYVLITSKQRRNRVR